MAKLIDATDVLRRLMAAHNLNPAEVAEAARVTPVTANRWVNGKQRADSETLARAIRRLGDDPADYGIELRKPLDGDDLAPGGHPPAWFVVAQGDMNAKLDTIIDLLEHTR